MRRNTCLVVDAPDRIGTKRLHGTIGSIDRHELDAVDDEHLGLQGVDVDDVASHTEGISGEFDSLSDADEVLSSELPDGVVRVRIDHDGELDLTLELVELSSVLRLGQGPIVSGDVVDSETMLLKDVLALSCVREVVITEIDTTSVVRNTVEEASILQVVSRVHGGRR
jgi:hypothetical protein